ASFARRGSPALLFARHRAPGVSRAVSQAPQRSVAHAALRGRAGRYRADAGARAPRAGGRVGAVRGALAPDGGKALGAAPAAGSRPPLRAHRRGDGLARGQGQKRDTPRAPAAACLSIKVYWRCAVRTHFTTEELDAHLRGELGASE